jgi:alpha-galactosidase
MRLLLDGVEARGDVSGTTFRTSAPVDGEGPVDVGPVEVAIDLDRAPGLLRWSVANHDDVPVSVRSVTLVFRIEHAAGELRVLRHGYQSWSETSVAVLGVDEDPSLAEGSIRLVRGMHHADEDLVEVAGELRSEAVTVVRDPAGAVMLAGFVGGHTHDGTFRVRPDGADPARPGSATFRAEAFLGGAVLGPGHQRSLHPVIVEEGGDASELLEAWAGRVGSTSGARATAPYQVGWCSWYHYFHDVTEEDIRSNLARAADWPFDVFQVDDGYQAAIGDWLDTNQRFPTALDGLAAAIAAAGPAPGIWLAPFLAAPDSQVAADHPDWIVPWVDGSHPLVGMWNPGWGGLTLALDTTRPEVLGHLESTARSLVEAGYRYLKLDFTYAPSLDGQWHDRSLTPAERVRAGFDAIRRGAGDDVILLGCGAPLGATVGVVDAMRIGPDVAPHWHLPETEWHPPGYGATTPATASAWSATLARSFMHRRLWLDDPDCLMLRTDRTDMSDRQVEAWAHAVAASGGLAVVSDDLALLDPRARRLLDEVVSVGREVDQRAARNRPPRCPDLLDTRVPTTLESGPFRLQGDPTAGTASLERRDS